MKKTTLTLSAVLLAATLSAQELTNKIETRIIGFAQDTSAAKSVVVAIYPSYAPELQVGGKKQQLGFGLAALYPVSQYVYTGIRVDYLGGNFWAPSINVGLKADVQLFGVNITPMLYTGGVVPLSGAGDQNKDWGYITGGGAMVSVWKGTLFKKEASLTLAATAEKWSQFDGNVYHLAPVLRIKW